jgi:hypothetical protein
LRQVVYAAVKLLLRHSLQPQTLYRPRAHPLVLAP